MRPPGLPATIRSVSPSTATDGRHVTARASLRWCPAPASASAPGRTGPSSTPASAAARWWRTRWRRWLRCRGCRPRWWCWRRAIRSSRPTRRTSMASRPGSRAVAVPHAPPRWPTAWPSCNAAAPEPSDWVLVHDAARCLLRPEWVDRLIDACRDDAVGGLLALPLADTLKQARDGRVERTLDRATSGPRRRRRCSAWACCNRRSCRPGPASPTRPAPWKLPAMRRCWCQANWRTSSSPGRRNWCWRRACCAPENWRLRR